MNAACPAEETLGNLVAGALPQAEKTSVLEHLDSCGSCRFIVAALAQSRSPATESTVALAGPEAPRLDRGTTFGRYTIRDVLGGGGMGVVYAAYDPILDRKVALKLLKHEWAERRTDARARLLREAQVMARLQHANVITVLDVGAVGERDFIAMELVDGATLTGWLARARRPWREVLDTLIAAGRGLEAAHAEGLVHRDFKPDNVLVSQSGRVLVTDFGLARVATSAAPDDGTGATQPVPLDSGVHTRTGAVVGTPAYMAPEQLAGHGADARSDQFSFCVAAFEALYGTRPFSGATVSELADAIAAQRIARSAARADAPAALRKILVRGLAADPSQRHSSMAALLETLSRLGHRRQRALLAASGALVLGLAAVAVVQVTRPARLCRGAGEKFASAWNETRRTALEQSFAATNVPYAADAFAGVQRALDAYRDRWVAQHDDSCRATRIRGEQSDELYTLSLACLDDRLRAVTALERELEHADAPLVQRAVSAVARLPPLDSCADARLLRARVPPPADPNLARAVRALDDKRARIDAMETAGRYSDGLAAARPLAADAQTLGYRPLQATTQLLLGLLQNDVADYDGAARSLHAAVLAAEAAGDVDTAARAWGKLILVDGDRRHAFAEAHADADHARALIERMGGSLHHTAFVDANLAEVLSDEGRYAEARKLLEEVLPLLRRDGDDLIVAVTLTDLGNILGDQGDHAGAVKYYEESLKLVEGALGPQHPKTAQALKSIGNLHFAAGELDEALASYRRALAIEERALGPDHPETNSMRINVGGVCAQKGDYDAALVELRRAIASDEKRLGPDSPELLAALNDLAVVLEGKHELGPAEAMGRRALAIAEKTYGPTHPQVQIALLNLADVLHAGQQFAQALPLVERAVAISEKTLGAEHPSTAENLGELGLMLVDMGRPRDALAPLERASRIGDTHEMDAVNLAKIRFALARALEQTGERTRAMKLAHASRKVLAATGPRQAPDVAEIDNWLAQRR